MFRNIYFLKNRKKQTFFKRGRPKKFIEQDNERLINLRLKEKQRRVSIIKGIEILREILKQQGWSHYMSKSDVLKRSVELIDILEKQIDILHNEKDMWFMIHIVEERLENHNINSSICSNS